MLHGRANEAARIVSLLDQARSGRSGVLVVRGQAGIGKSALLDHAGESATGMRMLRIGGIESESELPFAGLQLLLRPCLDRIDTLPRGQERALRAALGLDPGEGGDRYLVGLAVLTLLSELAEDRPLLCLIDDAHWLDHGSAHALLFAARRLHAEPIAVIFAARDEDAPEFLAPGLAELRLAGLDDGAADRLLAERADPVPAHLRPNLLAEARGNPLALLELVTTAGHGRPERPETSSTYLKLRQTFLRRVAALPGRTQVLLLVAAAADSGDRSIVLPAARALGCTVADLEPAERARLLHGVDGRLEFRHPLIRTATYDGASLVRRLSAHRALAEVYGERHDSCRRAWHLSSAATEPDETVAATLERAARLGDAAGGLRSSTAIYERAADLTPEPAPRGRRLTAAARAAADAGQLARAAALADRAAADLRGPLELADIALIRATMLDEQDRPKDAHRLLADTARSVVASDPELAGSLLFRAARAAAKAGDLAALDRTAARATALDVPKAALVRAVATVFAGQNALASTGADAATGALRDLVDAVAECDGLLDMVDLGWWQLQLGDLDAAHDTATGLELEYRERGAIGLLAGVLPLLARTQLMLGRHREALATATEGLRIAADTGQHRYAIYLSTVLAQLAAIEGDERRCIELTAEPLARGVAPGNVHASGALSLLDLGLGRYEAAVSRLTGLLAGPNLQGVLASLPDLVEAALRTEHPDVAAQAAGWYQNWAGRLHQPWAEATALRCRALLAENASAGELYARAVALHRRGGPPFERARSELLYGEWLRRARHGTDARAQLRPALEAFTRLEARPWAERTRAELRATGERVRPPGSGQSLDDRLTPQELQVVRLASRGMSNRDIGARLFLSPRTVGYHLYKAYPKLGVTSRGELAAITDAVSDG